MILQRIKQTLLASTLMLTGGLVYAADPQDMICTYTSTLNDTIKVTRQDRPITISKTANSFAFEWQAQNTASPTPMVWELEADLSKAEPLTAKITRIKFDDNIKVFINGQNVYAKDGGGTNGITLNQDVSQHFKVGQVNKIRVEVIDTTPKNGSVGLNIEYTEGGCKPIDYSAPVCSDGIDGDACIEKLNTFCAEPQNAKFKDCMDWKEVQNEVLAGANNNGTVAGGGGAGAGGGGGAGAATLMFSPSAFATQQAVGMIAQVFSCKSAMSEEEKNLPNRLSANLCIYVGEYCSKEVRILGAKLCRTKKKTYCCFNSTLSRIINQEGNKQLGRGMGDPKNATCNGFTIDEFSRLDLSKMDLTEFIDEVTAKANATAQKSGSFWTERNEARTEKTFANVNTEDLKYKLLTAEDPYSVLNQPTDGKAKVDATARTVDDETAQNTVTTLETGIKNLNQDELDEAKNKFKNKTGEK